MDSIGLFVTQEIAAVAALLRNDISGFLARLKIDALGGVYPERSRRASLAMTNKRPFGPPNELTNRIRHDFIYKCCNRKILA